MLFTGLFVLLLAPLVSAGDNWEDFTNNLATDLAPLITLFGERLTKQFLSESISLLDNVIFALSPLGVLTAVVSVIRVCGSSSLRAFIGRAQEGPAEAESELLPCVSESTAELFNDGGISRVFGRPKIVEIITWKNHDHKTGEESIEIGTLRQALQSKAWSATGKGSTPTDEDIWDLTRLPALDIPNLSLNKGIKRRKQFWFYCAAILGALLQTGVIIYAAITVFIYPASFKKDDEAVPSYAFPFYIIGTVFLFVGMLYCAIIIERSSKEYYFKPNTPSKIYWLQPGNQHVGDQVFNAFMAVEEGPNSTMTRELQYIKSTRIPKYDGRYVEIYSTLFFTMLGFIVQFIGLRGLHASVILAQLGSTLLMSILRTCLRTERMAPGENKLKNERYLTSHRQQELDSFAFHLENVESFNLVSSVSPEMSTETSTNSSRQTTLEDISPAKQIVRTRARLAELSSSSDHGSTVTWGDIPIRKMAQSLTETIEATMNLMSSWGVEFGKSFQFPLSFQCQSPSINTAALHRETYHIGLLRCGDALRWKLDTNELEAILGLWTWSLYKSDENWQRPLSRLVGLTKSEASNEETYLCFHKWIFRQTEARMGPSEMIATPSHLFGFESTSHANNEEILVARTDNELEAMAAQDIYVHFLLEACGYLNELGGEVDVVPGMQNSWLSHSSRINDLMYCVEKSGLGTREDALLCIVPVLRSCRILPELAADCNHVRERIETLTLQNDWKKAFSLLRWLAERSEGSEFERSMCEMGYLCRRAILDNNKIVCREGFKQICDLLRHDVREKFYESRRLPRPPTWPRSSRHTEWWQSFSTQLRWIAWSISANCVGMQWMQQDLKPFGVQEDLSGSRNASYGKEDIERGKRALREWLTLNHLMFSRGVCENDDEIGLEWAIENSHQMIVHFLLVRWVELSTQCPALLQVAWDSAAKLRSQWAIDILRQYDADIEALDPDGRSALVMEVGTRNLEGTRVLLQNGANPNGSDKAQQMRPFIIAARNGFDEILELLILFGANLETPDQLGFSALQWASRENRVDTVRLLASHGADVNSQGGDGLTPLIAAITDSHFEMVELLLEVGGDINARDPDGQTALMFTAMWKSVSMLELLIKRGADISLRDRKGFTAVDYAKDKSCMEAVSILECASSSLQR